jgi:hypothetical protein
MQWKPFQFRGKIYDLSHLHPRSVIYEQPPKGDAPAHMYKVDVIFGLHCFTRGVKADERFDPALMYSDDRETRIFDFIRYGLSVRLPEIVNKLPARKCYHTGKGNFFTVEIAREDGEVAEYDVFFVASRSSTRGRINLYVQGAYLRDPEHAANRPTRKPVGFYVILFNTLNRKPIRLPR